MNKIWIDSIINTSKLRVLDVRKIIFTRGIRTMVTWKNLDTLASYEELAKVEKVNLKTVDI